MAAESAVADGGGVGGEAAGGEEQRPNWMRSMFPMMLIMTLVNLYMQYSMRGSGSAAANATASAVPAAPIVPAMPVAPAPVVPEGVFQNAWQDGHPFYLRAYLTPDAEYRSPSESDLLWSQEGLFYNWDPQNERQERRNLTVSSWMLRNQTLFAHLFFVTAGHPLTSSYATDDDVIHFRYNMTRHIKAKASEGVSLLNSTAPHADEETTKKNKGEGEVAPLDVPPPEVPKQIPGETYLFWKPILNIDLVHSFVPVNPSKLPGGLGKSYQLNPSKTFYFPVVFVNEINLIVDNYIAVNETVKELPLSLYYNTYSQLKWQIQQQMTYTWEMQVSFGMAESDEIDEIKRIFLETSPWLLSVTMVVSLLHTVFDFLAFKNDISFWRNAKSYEGLSIRSIVMNAGSQFIVLLYLLDNDTSWMILISNVIGLMIELWKIKKTMRVKLVWFYGVPLPKIRDRVVVSKTKEYDEEATRYLSWLMNPLVVLYAVYTLYFNKYKSWYSWIISSLTSFVYMFGFIMMTPQLYINYKFKSVAHMPWRAMIYKSLNTFIDDLFSFVVKMPMMHRIACLRDDVVFFVYLYQKWAYPVDKKRRNEFGLTGEEDEQLQLLRKRGVKNITMEAIQRAIAESHCAAAKKDDDLVAPGGAPPAPETSIASSSTGTVHRRKEKGSNAPSSSSPSAPSSTALSEGSAHRSKLEKIELTD